MALHGAPLTGRSATGRLESLVVGVRWHGVCVEFCSAWKLVEEESWPWNLSGLYSVEENRIESDSK